MRARSLLSLLLALPLIASRTSATCTGNATYVCVSYNGSDFVLTGGRADACDTTLVSGQNAAVYAYPGDTLTFVYDSTTASSFSTHPFIITSSASGGCGSSCAAPIYGTTNPSTALTSQDATMTYTVSPTAAVGANTADYYQSTADSNIGNKILITSNPALSNATCTASSTGSGIGSSTNSTSTSSTGVAGGSGGNSTTGGGGNRNGGWAQYSLSWMALGAAAVVGNMAAALM